MKEYVVTFKVGYQVSINDWDTEHLALKVNESTTVKEIESFFKKYDRHGRLDVTLSDLAFIDEAKEK